MILNLKKNSSFNLKQKKWIVFFKHFIDLLKVTCPFTNLFFFRHLDFVQSFFIPTFVLKYIHVQWFLTQPSYLSTLYVKSLSQWEYFSSGMLFSGIYKKIIYCHVLVNIQFPYLISNFVTIFRFIICTIPCNFEGTYM